MLAPITSEKKLYRQDSAATVPRSTAYRWRKKDNHLCVNPSAKRILFHQPQFFTESESKCRSSHILVNWKLLYYPSPSTKHTNEALGKRTFIGTTMSVCEHVFIQTTSGKYLSDFFKLIIFFKNYLFMIFIWFLKQKCIHFFNFLKRYFVMT